MTQKAFCPWKTEKLTCSLFPSATDDGHFKTIFQVELLTWRALSWDNSKATVQSLSLQYQQWVPCHLGTSPKCNYWLKELSISRYKCGVSFQVSLINDHFKTKFQVKLYWIKELCLLGDLNNESVESSTLSLSNSLFKTISPVRFYQLKQLCPRRPK